MRLYMGVVFAYIPSNGHNGIGTPMLEFKENHGKQAVPKE